MALSRVPAPSGVYSWDHLLLLLLLCPFAILAHAHNVSGLGFESEAADLDSLLIPRQSAEKPFYLRIMPLGASITAGYGTNPQNGYRKPLRDQLRWRGWPVNMVGSQADGDPETFHNRQHEGHSGYVVNQMIGVADNTIPKKPNVVLINCGTNDADPNNNQDIPNTPKRMEDVLNHLYDNIEGVTIILSTLMPRKDSSNSNVDIINPGYRDLVRQFNSTGHKIVLAEFNNGFLDLDTDYFDNIHPNEKGAAKLAAVWDEAIQDAERRNLLTQPADTGTPDNAAGSSDETCDVVRGAGRGPVKTQQGSGLDDGPFAYSQGPIVPINLGPQDDLLTADDDNAQVYFAQLVNLGGADPGGERDELVYCSNKDTNTPGTCVMYLNDAGDFTKHDGSTLDVGLQCLVRGIRWGDVNGDGLDDFICINLQGNMYVSINQGGSPPTFKPTGNGGLIREGESWMSQAQVRLGDMDGDGRLDYCGIDDQGDIYCWRNGGVGLAPTTEEGGYWQGLVGGEPTFYAQHEPEGIEGVHLVDINGDGRADWVYVYDAGNTKIFTNQRGSYDEDGKGLRPHWTRATQEHPTSGLTTRKRDVIFGRVQGTGRADVILTGSYLSNDNRQVIAPIMFGNAGSGGTRVKGDGVYYCDMFGRGRDDYLWVRSNGEITLYENILSPPNWGQHGVIINIDRDRKSIHFGDWDGDGLCDILAVERHTGRVEWWRNTYQQGSASPTFDSPKWAVDSGSNLCTEGWGRGVYDQGLRFGDLDGDKRVDYLCMEKDARTVGHLNKETGLEDKGQIKFAPAERLDRANFKWADVTGDGLVDLIWVDKFIAEARVWKNGGFIPSGGSSMFWDDQGIRFDGHGRGANIHFPILGDKHRADYHDVYPSTCIANTWFNECAGSGQGQDDYPEPIDPNLPTPPPSTGDGGSPTATTSIGLPSQPTVTGTFTGLYSQYILPARPGDVFTYNFADGSDRNVQIALLEQPEDFPNIDCGVHLVEGEDGDTLSCVAESIAWMYYSINLLGGPVETNPESKRRDESSVVRRAQHHAQWKPQGNCSTAHCMLLSTAPLNTWVPASNGTSGGVFHDLHFINFGDIIGHRVYRGGYQEQSSNNRLSDRQYTYQTGRWEADFYRRNPHLKGLNPYYNSKDWYNRGSSGTELQVSDNIGSAVEEVAADTDYHNLCIGLGVGDSNPDYGYMEMGYQGLPGSTLDQITGNLDDCDDYLGNPSPKTIVCYANISAIDPDLMNSDPGADTSTGPLPWQTGLRRLFALARRWLFGRAGNSGSEEPYKVYDVLHGTGYVTIVSDTYPSGNNGQDLDNEKANGDTTAYGLANPADCLDGSVTDNAQTDLSLPNAVNVETEHMFPERRGAANLFEYVQDPRMDLADGNGEQSSNLPPISYDIISRWAVVPYRDWVNNGLPAGFDMDLIDRPGSFANDLMDALGTTSNPTVMTNLDGALNRYKARVLNTRDDAIADSRFEFWANNPSIQNTGAALSELRLGFGSFEYMNDNHVLDLTSRVYQGMLAEANQFDFLMGMANPNGPTNFRQHLPQFLRFLVTRMVNNHRRFIDEDLDVLGAPWVTIQQATASTSQQQIDAAAALDLIGQFRARINTYVNFNADDFINR